MVFWDSVKVCRGIMIVFWEIMIVFRDQRWMDRPLRLWISDHWVRGKVGDGLWWGWTALGNSLTDYRSGRENCIKKYLRDHVQVVFNRCSFPAWRTCALGVLGLLLADGAPTLQWGGGRLFDALAKFFFFTKTAITRNEKWKNRSEGWKWTVSPRATNGPLTKVGGRMAKIRFLGRKLIFRAKKKHSPLNSNHVLATTGQSCEKKKVPFSQINISLLQILGVFFWEKRTFGQKKHFSAERKNGHYSEIPVRTRSIVIVGHFFDGPDSPTKFCWPQSKIKGTYTNIRLLIISDPSPKRPKTGVSCGWEL